MPSPENLSILSAVLYLISALLLLKPLIYGQQQERKWLKLVPASIGLIVHGYMIFGEIVQPKGLNLNFIHSLSLTALLTVSLFLLLTARRPIENLGIGVLPIAALTVLTGALYENTPNTFSTEIQLHIFFSVTAYGLLALAALQAILVSLQNKHLKNHRPGGFIRTLPPLNLMENTLFSLLNAGFIVLSLSLLSGFLFLQDMFAQHLVHKTLLSILAWTIFAILLFGRHKYGWRGKTAVSWTLSAFALLILAYFGSKFVLELILHQTSG